MSTPRLKIALPRPVEALHQIEITSRCNLRCSYCPHRIMRRSQVDMDKQTFIRCLSVARRFVDAGTQFELNLAGLGESTLHPAFCEYVAMAREAMGTKLRIVMATNGVALTKTHVEAMANARMNVWVSLHHQDKAGLAIHLCRQHGILAGVSADAGIYPNNWAGQVDWVVHQPDDVTVPCHWMRTGRVMVCSNGDITTCCLDAHGAGIIGNIHRDDMTRLQTKPYELCKHCYQEIAIVDYAQH